ncbi:hypothetical protein [Microbispora sp. ATCC PTA-5024]|uniref:hypothetical protein n=1 Tax=Microbispora sp. ATCC PTA-5024 TaxID=316330 RepID=UPI0003DD6F89|nr:hypothetical protein [Microbispora sp. ATCC PTA-5024]ETK32789.1 hypothetical protein MPTA5024_27945 [Microbispora sp. ATCC PTA-5024]
MVEVMRSPRWFRLIRAWLFAMVCVGLSQAGHDLMAPQHVPAWSSALALGAVTVAGYRLADRERSSRWILAAVETVQLYLHVWYAWTTPEGAAQGVGWHAGVHHAGTGAVAPAVVAHATMSAPAMFVVHALAGAFVTVWLSIGERALWRALRRLIWVLSARLGWILAPVLPASVCHPGTVGPTAQDDDPPAVVLLRHALRRRGPPRRLGPRFVLA